MLDEASKSIAQDIWKAITASKKILLHCHPSPDGDSVGSTLATYHALKNMGKDVTAIWGDSGLTPQFLFLPGASEILDKHFFEMNLDEYDLFIIQDSASIDRVSMKNEIIFPSTMRTIVIDHHVSNTRYGEINLVPDTAPATAAILYELFTMWNVEITKEIAICLMLALFTDTGGFRHQGVTSRVFEIMAHLATIEPRYTQYIAEFENDAEYERVAFMGLAYNSIRFFLDKKIAMSVVSHDDLLSKGLNEKHTQKHFIANVLKSIKGVMVGIECTEIEPGKVKFSMRSKNSDVCDVSKIAAALGGGGHRAAAGVLIPLPLDQALEKFLNTVKEIYPEL